MSGRNLLREVLVYGLGDLLQKVGWLVALPIYTRVFAPSEFGVWSYVNAVLILASALVMLGSDAAFARYFFEAKTREDRRIVTSTAVWALASWSVVAVAVALPFAPWFSAWSFGSRDQEWAVTLALAALPLVSLNNILAQALRNEFRARLYTILSAASTVLTIGLGLTGAALLHRGVPGLFEGALAAAAIVLPVRLWTVRHLLAFTLNRAVARRMLAYGLPLVPAALGYWVLSGSDRILLGRLSTIDDVGLYSVAANLSGGLALLLSGVSLAWSPRAFAAYEQDRGYASRFFGRAFTYLVACLGLLAVGVTAFAPEILRILSTPAYFAAAAAVGPLCLGLLAYGTTQVTALPISLHKRTILIALYAWIAAVVNVGLNLVLIPRWGILGASWSTAAAFTFLTLAYIAHGQRIWPIAYEWRRCVATAGLTTSLVICAPYFPSVGTIGNVGVHAGIVAAYLVGLLLFGVIGAREWRTFRAIRSPPAPVPAPLCVRMSETVSPPEVIHSVQRATGD